MYCVYREGRGQWRLGELSPGIADDRVLVRDLGDELFWPVKASEVISLVSYDAYGATSVYPFIDIEPLDESLVHRRYAYAANVKLPPAQVEIQSGYPKALENLKKLRREKLSITTIRGAAIFAALSARIGNGICERLFYNLWPYIESGELEELSPGTINGLLMNEKPRIFASRSIPSLWSWCEEIEPIINSGMRDRELRRVLAFNVGVAHGLGMAKLSFFLELLGNDVACLDTHMLAIMTGSVEEAERLSSMISKRSNKKWPYPWKPFTELSVQRYEQQERRLCAGNPYYDKGDEFKLARCQWMSWEHVRGEPTEHRAILETLTAFMRGEEQVPDLGEYLAELKGMSKVKFRRAGRHLVSA